jgi:diadenosine tetraphosphate (Ap4A) HIT family hydrolase
MLVVPARHLANLYSVDDDIAGPLMKTLSRVAAAAKIVANADGVSVRQNNELHGGQDVFHLHFHVIPRFAGDGFNSGEDRFPFGTFEVPLEERIEQASRLREALSQARSMRESGQ